MRIESRIPRIAIRSVPDLSQMPNEQWVVKP